MSTFVASRPSLTPYVVTILALWATTVAVAASQGLVAAMPAPVVPTLTVFGIGLPMLAYARMPALRDWFARVGLRRLTLFQAWRIGPAFLFFGYGAQGLLPAPFVADAGWGDLIAGLLGLVTVVLPMQRWRYWGTHVFGAIDLIVAMSTAVYFSLTDPASMAAVRWLPLALIPLFGVSVTFTTHLIAFDLLRKGDRAES